MLELVQVAAIGHRHMSHLAGSQLAHNRFDHKQLVMCRIEQGHTELAPLGRIEFGPNQLDQCNTENSSVEPAKRVAEIEHKDSVSEPDEPAIAVQKL